MKFLLDESADYQLRTHLEGLGHDVKDVAHDFAQALTDEAVLAIANDEDRVLVTNDHDFGELIFRRGLEHSGVILFRVRDERLPTKIGLLDHLLDSYIDRLSEFVVVSEAGVRVRSRD